MLIKKVTLFILEKRVRKVLIPKGLFREEGREEIKSCGIGGLGAFTLDISLFGWKGMTVLHSTALKPNKREETR